MTDQQLIAPGERDTIDRLFDFALVLRAAAAMPPDEDEYWEKPWKWDDEYQIWLRHGSPRLPEYRQPVNLSWERFVRDLRDEESY